MASKTLILNADYTLLSTVPISMIDWQDAIKLEVTGVIEPIEYYDDWVVHSPSTEFMVPAVVRLTEYKKFRKTPKFTSRNVYIRDEHICQYCEVKFPENELTRDHVIPRKFGGKTNWENISTACLKCNNRRGHNTQIQPIRLPYKPTMAELEAKTIKNKKIEIFHESWLPFFGRWPEENIIKLF